jgi:LytS/YehU family sensor histidine kinase
MGKARAWFLYALAWVPIAVLYAAALSQEVSPGRAVQGAIVSVTVAAILGVGVWRVSGMVPWRIDRVGRFLALHLLLAVAFVGLWIAAIYARLAIQGGWDLARHVAIEEGGWTVVVGFWIYGLLVGGSHAIRAERRAARAQAERARAELGALRARLQPHFLFNTLHTIRALVRRRPEQAADAIERLGELLRYVVDLDGRDTELVPFREELAFARAYLELERIRLGERMAVEESIDPEALDVPIPALTLQPLLENAIRHGIAPRSRGGTIRLAVQRAGAAIEIVVEDDGVGAAWPPENGAGVGLASVRRRIASRYDGAGRFEVTTGPGAGFRVAVRLPAEVD